MPIPKTPPNVDPAHLQSNEKLLTDYEITKVKRYFKTHSKEKKLSRKDAKNLLNVDLKFSVVKLKNGKLMALYQGKQRDEVGFENDKSLGVGGFGSVKLGQMLDDGQWVAVKIQKKINKADQRSVESFKDEIKNLSISILNEIERKQAAIRLLTQDETLTDLEKNPQIEKISAECMALMDKLSILEGESKSKSELKTELKEWRKNIDNEATALEKAQQLHGKMNRTKTKNSALNEEKSYMAMSFHNGMEIYDAIKTLDLNDTEREQMALAALKELNAFHEKGYIHRDIKPENIMWDPKTNECVLIDFGLSVKTKKGKYVETNPDNSPVGTKEYTAPEISRKNNVYNKETDAYAIGKVVNFILTGNPNQHTPLGDQLTGYDPNLESYPTGNRISLSEAIHQLEHELNTKQRSDDTSHHSEKDKQPLSPYFESSREHVYGKDFKNESALSNRGEASEMHFQNEPAPKWNTNLFDHYLNQAKEKKADQKSNYHPRNQEATNQSKGVRPPGK